MIIIHTSRTSSDNNNNGCIAHLIGAAEEPVMHKVRRSMREQRISLHLAETDAAVDLPAVDGLAGERVDRAFRAHLWKWVHK